MMRELTVKVSDNQFDTLVNFLRTLPYVQLPSVLKKNDIPKSIVDDEQPIEIVSLGEMDNAPFDIENIVKNHSIQWEHLEELKELFKDAPFDTMLEELSK